MLEHTCESVRDRLPEWASGALSAEERRGVDDHLARCEPCRGLAEVVREMRSRAPAVPPEGLARTRAAALAAFREEFGPEDSGEGDVLHLVPGGSGRSPRRPLRWSLPAAAVLVLALGVTRIWNLSPGTGAPGANPEAEFSLEASAEGAGVEGSGSFLNLDDALVAGGVVLENLSDDELETLLTELGA